MRPAGLRQRPRRAIRLVAQCLHLCNNCQCGIFNDAASCQDCATSASKELISDGTDRTKLFQRHYGLNWDLNQVSAGRSRHLIGRSIAVVTTKHSSTSESGLRHGAATGHCAVGIGGTCCVCGRWVVWTAGSGDWGMWRHSAMETHR